jgi:hypothetical protein
MNTEFLKKIPEDVVVNHIIPFTYEKQPANLLQDIRSFYTDFSTLENAYSYHYNFSILFHDLICFCNRSRIPNYNMNDFFGIVLKRLFKLQTWEYDKLNVFVFVLFHRDAVVHPLRKIRFLWGILTPTERTRFINNFVLEDEYNY